MQGSTKPSFYSREVYFLAWGEVTRDDDKGNWEVGKVNLDGKGDTHTHKKDPGTQGGNLRLGKPYSWSPQSSQ